MKCHVSFKHLICSDTSFSKRKKLRDLIRQYKIKLEGVVDLT